VINLVLNDKYKIERKIGEGGFAVVYRGFDLVLKRPVAIKILKDSDPDGRFQKQFLREAESMAQFNHSNIVTVYDSGTYKEALFLVMQLVNGPSLLELVRDATLPAKEVCELGIEVCHGMAYAHRQGVFHRDLTLKNIMVDNTESTRQVKILDFGLAKIVRTDSSTGSAHVGGTVLYMSPEQVRGESVDGRTDIFAFGVGLHRMLTGRFPFEAEHPTAIMYLILNDAELSFEDTVPRELADIIQQCLEKDPRVRPRDFDEVEKALESAKRACEKAGAVSSTSSVVVEKGFKDRTSKRNPYLNRVMIRHPNEFFGREREVRKIYSRLDAPHPQSISIVGERKIGKSSLLNYIYHRRNRRKYMQNYDNAIFVYLDFQRIADFDVYRFIDFLIGVCKLETGGSIDHTSRGRTLDDLKGLVETLHGQGKRLIILMDEFERVTRNEKFDENFFSFLRSLANSYPVAYVTSSYEELQRMCHNQDISDSPFFNIFSNLPLRTFSDDEARDLIKTPSRVESVPLEPHADRIVTLAGYFPLYLQIACSSVFEYLVADPGREPDWDAITAMFREEAYPHFDFVWEHMDEPSRENLRRIAAGKDVSKKYEYLNEGLVRRGYLKEEGGGVKVFSESFREFVAGRGAAEKKAKWSLGSLLRRGT
jgi:serine/threonine protein kinase